MTADNRYGRYRHQILLRDFGEAAQQKLLDARVLVVGAGGLGCAALQYLVAAGAGTIGIADDDTVHLTNLHRQVLYGTNDIGYPKAKRAARRLKQLNPDIEIQVHPLRLTPQNTLGIIGSYDIIVDGTDNHGSKYMINDACVLTGKPFIFGAVSESEGQLAVFNAVTNGSFSANYRDVFPYQWPYDKEAGCNETGVIGVLTGIIGCMQGNEVIKVITHTGNPLVNRLVTFNALTGRMHEFSIQAGTETRKLIPADAKEFMQARYEMPCTNDDSNFIELPAGEFQRLINRNDITVIDVRENPGPTRVEFQHIHIPFGRLKESLPTIKGDTIITFCEKGILSLKAALLLKEAFQNGKKIYSLRHGINNWNNTNNFA